MGAGCGAPAPRGGQRDGEPAAVGGRVGPCPPAAQQHRRGSRPRWMAAVQPPPDGCAPASSSGAPTASPPALDAAEPPAPLAGWESPPAGWGGGRAASPDGWLAGCAGCRPGWLGVGLPRGAGPPPTCPRGWLAARLAIGGWVFVCESPGEGRLLSDRVRMRARAAQPEASIGIDIGRVYWWRWVDGYAQRLPEYPSNPQVRARRGSGAASASARCGARRLIARSMRVSREGAGQRRRL